MKKDSSLSYRCAPRRTNEKNNVIFNSHSEIFISPHTASRTIDNVQNQAVESIENMEQLINEKNF